MSQGQIEVLGDDQPAATARGIASMHAFFMMLQADAIGNQPSPARLPTMPKLKWLAASRLSVCVDSHILPAINLPGVLEIASQLRRRHPRAETELDAWGWVRTALLHHLVVIEKRPKGQLAFLLIQNGESQFLKPRSWLVRMPDASIMARQRTWINEHSRRVKPHVEGSFGDL